MSLDRNQCQNPDCPGGWLCDALDPHHIKKQSQSGYEWTDADLEWIIVLGRGCHDKCDGFKSGGVWVSGGDFQIRMLEKLKQTRKDFRWQVALDYLYGLRRKRES